MENIKDIAERYFYQDWYEVDSSVDYKDYNVKSAILEAFTAGYEKAQEQVAAKKEYEEGQQNRFRNNDYRSFEEWVSDKEE